MYWAADYVLRVVLRIVFRLKVYGKEKIPREGPVILCCNHISYADPLIMGIEVPRQITFLAKKELFSAPVLGKLISAIGTIPVNRGKNDMTVIRETIAVLENGGVIALFPEGTRVRDGSSRDAKAGVGLFAVKTGAAVVPVGIKAKTPIGLFSKIEVHYGDPISAADFPAAEGGSPDYQHISDYIMNKVRELAGK